MSTEQIDFTITINADHYTPAELVAIRDQAAEAVTTITGGELVKAQAARVTEAITGHTWTNDLVREIAWLVADRHDGDEDERDQIIAWMNDNEDDENIWHEVSNLIDAITYRAQNF